MTPEEQAGWLMKLLGKGPNDCPLTWNDLYELATLQKAEVERLSLAQFMPIGDNHHNAALCPHCGEPLRKALAEIERLRAVIGKLNILDIASIEAFCTGVKAGQPTQQQVEAMMDAAGGIRRLLRQHGEACPLGQGRTTAAYLRKLAEECEREAAEAKEEA